MKNEINEEAIFDIFDNIKLTDYNAGIFLGS